LTHLSLHSIAFEDIESAPYLPALLFLELEISHAGEASAKQFAAMLTNTPGLDTLIVEFASYEDGDSPLEEIAHVSLPHLRTLHVITSSEALSWLLQIIPWPSRNLYLDCHEFKFGKPDLIVYNYLIRFWSDITKRRCISKGCMEWTSGIGALRFGEKFDCKTDANEPRLLFYYPYCSTIFQLPPELMELVECIDFYGVWKRSDVDAFQGFGYHVRRIIVQHVAGLHIWTPCFEDWVRGQAKAGYPLESIMFTSCSKDKGLYDYSQELSKEGVVGEVLWE
jgi:hypothetical protein